MWICPECGEDVDDTFALCWNCQCARPGEAGEDSPGEDPDAVGESLLVDPPQGPNVPQDILLATGPAPPGRVVIEPLGVVVGKGRVVPTHRRLSAGPAGVAELILGRPPVPVSPDQEAVNTALIELLRQAQVLGADAVVELEMATEGESVITVTASGRAVRLRPQG